MDMLTLLIKENRERTIKEISKNKNKINVF